MKKFLVLFTAPEATREKMQSATSEEMQAGMQPWMEWFGKMGDALVDKGSPVTNAMAINEEGISHPGNVDIVAYDIIQAENIDEAVKLMRDNPHLQREGAIIDIHEMWDMNGMLHS